eukprot:Opistho-2@21522
MTSTRGGTCVGSSRLVHRLRAVLLCLDNLQIGLILLVAPEIRVAHEVQSVLVVAGIGGFKVKLHLGALLERHPLDRHELVGGGITENNPPALSLLPRIERRNDGADFRLVVLPLHDDIDSRRRLAWNALLCTGNFVRELNIRIAIAKARDVLHLARRQLEHRVAVALIEFKQLKYVVDLLFLAPLNDIRGEVGHLLEHRIAVPLCLRHHLAEFHGGHGGRKPCVAADNVHARLYQRHSAKEDSLQVRLQLRGKLDAAEVRLKENVGLDVGIVELVTGQLYGQAIRKLLEDAVLAVPHGERVEFCRRANNLDEPTQLGLLCKRRAEELDGHVVDIVESGDHSQVEREEVHLVHNFNALRPLEISECILHEFREMVRQVTM